MKLFSNIEYFAISADFVRRRKMIIYMFASMCRPSRVFFNTTEIGTNNNIGWGTVSVANRVNVKAV